MKTVIDDRNRFRDQHPNKCEVGDLYKPWYMIKTPHLGSMKDFDQICLVYNRTLVSLDPNQVFASSYLKKPSSDDIGEYFNKSLAEDISKNGQKVPIVCTRHYTKDSPINVGFLEDPSLDEIHCFEGHHRLVAAQQLGINVTAEVYDLYHLETPVDYNKHFNSIYDDSFWSSFQQPRHRVPWFPISNFEDYSKTFKYQQLSKCFDVINKSGTKISNGVDIGCAEGAYSFFASKALGINTTGIDSEPGRIIRGLLMRQKLSNKNVSFLVHNWEHDGFDFDRYDFAMLLSILHHISNPEGFFEMVSKNKKAMLVEARVSSTPNHINSGSIKTIGTQDSYEKLFEKNGFNYEAVAQLNDRIFYVLLKK